MWKVWVERFWREPSQSAVHLKLNLYSSSCQNQRPSSNWLNFFPLPMSRTSSRILRSCIKSHKAESFLVKSFASLISAPLYHEFPLLGLCSNPFHGTVPKPYVCLCAPPFSSNSPLYAHQTSHRRQRQHLLLLLATTTHSSPLRWHQRVHCLGYTHCHHWPIATGHRLCSPSRYSTCCPILSIPCHWTRQPEQ